MTEISQLTTKFDDPPSKQDPTNFDANADQAMSDLENLLGTSGELSVFITETNFVASEVNAAKEKAQDWAEEAEDVEVESGQYSALHHATKAIASKTAAESAQGLAETARDKAQDWAEEAEDTEVESGQYSALHHAAKALASKTAAESAQGLAEAAQGLSETAQGLAETARDKAQNWAEEAEDTEVETGQYSALHHAAKALASKTAAESAQGLAETARDKAQDWAEEVEDTEVESGRYSALHHATKAAASETAAETAQGLAETARDKAQDWAEEAEDVEVESGQYSALHHATKAIASKTAAESAQGLAETARDKAQDWAEEAEDTEVETGQYSALHHAAKALASKTAAESAQGLAETARDKAQNWAEEAEDVEVETGKYSALHHAAKAEAAKDAAEAAGHTQNTDTNLGTLGTKTTPIDADLIVQRDSASSNNLITSTWTQVKAFLKTYFDTLYPAKVTATEDNIWISDGSGGLKDSEQSLDDIAGGLAWSEISTNTTAVVDNGYMMTGDITLTLPATPTVGDQIGWKNISGTQTIARNGSNIEGEANDVAINIEGAGGLFVYGGATAGWVNTTEINVGVAHTQNTDTGTTSDTFRIGELGPIIKRVGDNFILRNPDNDGEAKLNLSNTVITDLDSVDEDNILVTNGAGGLKDGGAQNTAFNKDFASESEATIGTNETTVMNPLRTKQAIEALAPEVSILQIQIFS